MSFIKSIFVFLFFLIALNSISADEPECNLIEEKSPRLRLKRYLFCDYDATVRPVLDEQKNRTDVHIIIIPKLADFDDYTHTLNLHSWLYITWKDAHLKWTPSDFDGIDNLWVPSSEIWTPDLSIQNAGDGNYQPGFSYTNCVVSKEGTVVCVPAVLYTLQCFADYKYWPFDKQNCSLEFASWAHSKNEVLFNVKGFAIVMIHFYPSPQWKISPSGIALENRKSKYKSYEEFPTVIIHFNVERSHSALWRVFITPMFVMIVMNLTTLWLDPGSKERLLVACVNFVFHLFCIQAVHWRAPISGISVPNILIFYHNSIILAAIALIATCCLQKLDELKTPPPAWMNTYLSVILSSKVGQILLLSILDPKASAIIEEDGGDNSGLINTENQTTKSTWNYVIIVVSWILFFSFLFTYVIMLPMVLHVPNN